MIWNLTDRDTSKQINEPIIIHAFTKKEKKDEKVLTSL